MKGWSIKNKSDIKDMSPEWKAIIEPMLEAESPAARKGPAGPYKPSEEAASLRQRLIAVRLALDEGDIEAAMRIAKGGG